MKKISKPLLLIVALCMWGGCKDDSLQGDGNVTSGNEHLSYLCVNITTSDGNSAGTRAWGDGSAGEAADTEFDPGFEGEWALAPEPESHWLFFFNQDGTFHSASRLSEMNLTDVGTGEYPGNNEKTLGTFVAKVDISKGQAKPYSCLAVINGRPSRMQEVELNLEKGDTNGKTAVKWLMTKLTDPLAGKELTEEGPIIAFYTPNETGSKRINYCTMTNAVYVPGTSFTTQTGTVKVLQEIPDNKLCDTQDQAKNNALTIHVERMAVKMEVEFTGKKKTEKVKEEDGKKTIEGYDFPVVLKPEGDDNKVNQKEEGSSSTSKSWAAAIWGWRINAVAKQTYLFKNLDDATAGELDEKGTEKPKYNSNEDKVNEQFFANWNDANHFRSYWAVDPHYADAKIYPTQYRKAADAVATSRPYEGLSEEDQEKSPLHYYSYTESLARNYVTTDNAATRGNLLGHPVYRYCTENTLGEELLKGSTYEGAATHVLFIAQLLIGDTEVGTVTDGEGASYDADKVKEAMEKISDKYYSDGSYYNKADYMKTAYSKLWNGLKKGEMEVPDIFGKMESTEGKGDDLKFPKYVTSITLDGTEVTLTGTYMDEHVEDGIFELVPAEIISGDGRVMLGLKEEYKDKELIVKGGATESANEEVFRMNSNQLLSAVYEFAGYADYFKNGMMYYYVPIRHVTTERSEGSYQLGDIGVVRNHWYKITVNSVKRPGIPVSDPDQPIIPNVDPADQYLGLDIHILPWHVIKQNIDLK